MEELARRERQDQEAEEQIRNAQAGYHKKIDSPKRENMDRLKYNRGIIPTLNSSFDKLKSVLSDSNKTAEDDMRCLRDIQSRLNGVIERLSLSLCPIQMGTAKNGTLEDDEENNNGNISPLLVKRKLLPVSSGFDLRLSTMDVESDADAQSCENDDWRDTLSRSVAEPVKIKTEGPNKAQSISERQQSDVDDIFEETSAKSYKGSQSLVNGKCSQNELQDDRNAVSEQQQSDVDDIFEETSAKSYKGSQSLVNGECSQNEVQDDDADSVDTEIYDSTEMNNESRSSSRASLIFNSTADLLRILESDNDDDDKCGSVVENIKSPVAKDGISDSPKDTQMKDSPKLSDDKIGDPTDFNESDSQLSNCLKSESETESVHTDGKEKCSDLSQLSRLSVKLVDCIKHSSQSQQILSQCSSEATGDVSFLKSMDELLKVCRVEYLQPDYEMQSNLQHSDVADNLLRLFNDVEERKSEEEQLNKEIQNWSYTSSDSQSSDNEEFHEDRVNLRKVIIDESSHSVSSTDEDDIDRLCDLSTLNKRKRRRTKIASKKKAKLDSSSSTSSSSRSSGTSDDSDHSVSDDIELIPSRPATPKLDAATEAKINEIVMRDISDDIIETQVSSSEDEDEEEDKKKGGNGINSAGHLKVEDGHDDVKKLSLEQREKKSWRNDPLLTTKISSDSSDDSVIGSRKKRYSRRISSSESEANNRKKTINRFFSIDVSSDSSSCDSDCKIVGRDEKDVVELNEESDKQKGRRNIRALVSDECLAEATQRANREEQERIERLKERQRIMSETLSQFTPSLDETVEPLILDVDESGNPLVEVHRKLVKGLKPHQIEGVRFMWDSCYESLDMVKNGDGSGCILAHCMGLGKTAQVITLMQTLFAHKETNVKRVLVVCPLSTVPNWQKEIDRVFEPIPQEKFQTFAISNSGKSPFNKIKTWSLSKRSVLIIGYDLFRTITNEKNRKNMEDANRFRMVTQALIDPGPDLIVCDEGHLLMNNDCHRTKALIRVNTKRRIVLTGTPLQNNLKEYYHMVQFVKPNLLGTFKEYKTNFVNPITNGQYEDSTANDISLMKKRTHVLHNLLKKTIHRVEDTELKIYLPRIVDYAVFIKMTEFQTELHKRFMSLITSHDDYRNIISNYLMFQYIGSHPSVLIKNELNQRKKTKEQDVITMDNHENNQGVQSGPSPINTWYKTMMPDDVQENIEYGNKMRVLRGIIEESEKIGDKVLVFSQSLAEMDVIEYLLSKVGTTCCSSWKKEVDYLRMDGTVLPELRMKICDKFNDKSESKIRLLLMSIKVGGLGLNLTAANRVVIMTVSWNPSYDVQSVFRVYRFGQEKEVFVYRLVSVGTMEEKVYQRTVTKLAVARRVVDKHQIKRHYKTLDLEDMYSCKPELISDRPVCRLPEDAILATLMLKLTCLYKYHDHQTLLANRPEENLDPSEQAAAWEEFKNNQFGPPATPGPQPLQFPFVLPHALVFSSSVPSGSSSSSACAGAGAKTDKYKRSSYYSYEVVNRLHKLPYNQPPQL